MRWPAAGALACAAALAASLALPTRSEARPRAVIAFLPAASGPGQPLLDELARRPGLAIGLTSPTVGGFDKRQMALDMSQGARIPTRLYSKRIGALALRHAAGGWALTGWDTARRRAQGAPAGVIPGLLASTLQGAGRRVSYVGIDGRYALGAIVAADRSGRVASASVGPAVSAGHRAALELGHADLVVADLPPGPAGLAALDLLLAARGPDGLVYVVRAPEGDILQLLATGVAAPGIHGRLRSQTTRRTGLIAAIDVGPTVLRDLRVAVPDAMQGEPIEGRGRPDPGAVRALGDRLAVVSGRRGTSLGWLLGGWLALMAILGLAARERGLRAGVRIGLVAALWVPSVALLNAALAPGRLAEAAILALGSLGLGAATERLVRWPAAPALPAAVALLLHAVDLARGSPLIGLSITGPNPAGGARFYGIGNELETMLSFAALAGTGAALAWAVGRRPRVDRRRVAPLAFAMTAAAAAAVMGAGRLGADVGAVITLGTGGATAVLAAMDRRPSRRALALAVAAPVAAVGLLIAVDVITGGGAHLTRSVVHAHGSGDLGDVIRRRFEGSLSGLRHPGQAIAFAVALAIVAVVAARRERLLAPLAGLPGGACLRAGLIGAFFAVLAGTLANDSGPVILEIGAVQLALAAGYAWARPIPVSAAYQAHPRL